MDKRAENAKIAMQDKEFVARIASMEEPEDVQAAFAEKGVDLTLEEIDMIARAVMDGTSELDEDQLEAVAGGSATVVIGIIAGVLGVAGLFATDMASLNEKRKKQGKKTIW